MRSCSVIWCPINDTDKSSFFAVKDERLVLNQEGWKDVKHKWLCSKHFREKDILAVTDKSLYVPVYCHSFQINLHLPGK